MDSQIELPEQGRMSTQDVLELFLGAGLDAVLGNGDDG
jgi:hypothetical protein